MRSTPDAGRRFRVAMLAACPFPYPRGTPVRIFRMAEGLARRGHEVHVVTYHLGHEPGETPFRIHRIRQVGFYRRCAPGPTLGKLLLLDPMLVARLRRLLSRGGFDLIHAHHYEGLLVGGLARGRLALPLVYDAHTMLESELPFYGLALPQGLKRSLGRWLDGRLPRRADYVIAVSEEVRAGLVRRAGLSPERIIVVGNGVECEHFEAPALRGAPARDDKRTLIFTGNLAPYQGIELLLEAFARVVRAGREVRLLLVSGSDLGAYEPLARALRVRERIEVCPGGFDELPGLLASAHVALNPRPRCDGVPQKLLNYMAAGRPIVSFAESAPGLEHGRTGWLVDDGDVPAFAEGIMRLLDDPELAGRLGEAARERARAEHSWERNAERVELVYHELLARGAAEGGLAAREAGSP